MVNFGSLVDAVATISDAMVLCSQPSVQSFVSRVLAYTNHMIASIAIEHANQHCAVVEQNLAAGFDIYTGCKYDLKALLENPPANVSREDLETPALAIVDAKVSKSFKQAFKLFDAIRTVPSELATHFQSKIGHALGEDYNDLVSARQAFLASEKYVQAEVHYGMLAATQSTFRKLPGRESRLELVSQARACVSMLQVGLPGKCEVM